MNPLPIFFCLVLAISSCITSEHIIERESVLAKLDLDHSVINYISIDEDYLLTSRTLKSTIEYIKTKKFNTLHKYLLSIEKTGIKTSDVLLSRTLYYVSLNKYKEAANCLKYIPLNDYSKLTELLSIDLRFQIAKTAQTANYTSFLDEYQKLIDRHETDLLLKKIVYIRVRHLRYN